MPAPVADYLQQLYDTNEELDNIAPKPTNLLAYSSPRSRNYCRYLGFTKYHMESLNHHLPQSLSNIVLQYDFSEKENQEWYWGDSGHNWVWRCREDYLLSATYHGFKPTDPDEWSIIDRKHTIYGIPVAHIPGMFSEISINK